MQDPTQAAQGSAAPAEPRKTFSQKTPREKLVYVLKLAVCILSFGFIFPNLMSD